MADVTTPTQPGTVLRDHTAAAEPRASRRPTVVIVGAGFGGLRAARALRKAPVDVVLLDRHNYHLFQPLLYQVATAGLEPEQIAKPVRAILRGQQNFEFRMVQVTGVELAARQVVTDNGPVSYDYLILAVGGETNYFGMDSILRHGFGLKGVVDAVAIRNHVLRCFERAMLEPDAERRRALLTFVVVGGGPTGVEMAGALSELIRLVLVKDYPRLNIKDVRVLLLEATDRLLASLPARAASESVVGGGVRGGRCGRRWRLRCAGRWTPPSGVGCAARRRSPRDTSNRGRWRRSAGTPRSADVGGWGVKGSSLGRCG